MHNVGEIDFQQPSTSYHLQQHHRDKPITLQSGAFYSKPKNLESPEIESSKLTKEDDVISLDSTPEKNPTQTEMILESNPDNKIKKDKDMLTIDNICETIQKSNDIDDDNLDKNKSVSLNDQNKENLKTNGIKLDDLHLNGSVLIDDKKKDESKIELVVQDTSKPVKNTAVDKEQQNETNELTLVSKELPIEIMDVSENKDKETEKLKENLIIETDNIDENKIEEINLDVAKDDQLSELSKCRKRVRSNSDELNLSPKIVKHGKIGNSSTPIHSQTTNFKPEPPASVEPIIIENKQNDDSHPIKKLRAELGNNFEIHDKILTEYINHTTNDSPENIDKHINKLAIEIQSLNDMLQTIETEWDKVLNLKKAKEEICYRLTRKKEVMEKMNTKFTDNPSSGRMPTLESQINRNIENVGNSVESQSNAANLNIPNVASQFNTALLAAISANQSSLYNLSNNSSNSSNAPATQSILQNRANMKSTDLAKEKATTQRIHRLLVSSNILPKPSSSTSTTSGAAISSTLPLGTLFGSSSQGSSLTNLLGNHLSSSNQSQPNILNNYLTNASVQQQLGELLNGHHNYHHNKQQQAPSQQSNGPQNLMIGRQGVIKDVKSIIADYRQKHPDPPRRGRRLKSTNNNEVIGNIAGAAGNPTNSTSLRNNDFNQLLHKYDGNSRPSSNDSSSHSHHAATNNSPANNANMNISFKDVLVQFAKVSGQNPDRLAAVAAAVTASQQNSKQINHSNFGQNPPFPEVTLHPVPSAQPTETNGSLLHGILTKYNRANTSTSQSVTTTSSATSIQTATSIQPTTSCAPTSTTANFNSTTFAPTLARLLTAEQRRSPSNIANSLLSVSNNAGSLLNNSGGNSTGGLNLSKVVGHNSEITITPVVNNQSNIHQSLLQQQLQQNQLKEILSRQAGGSGSTNERLKNENFMSIDDEADDSVDRLVIDEGQGDESHQIRIAPNAIGQEFHENEVPVCQGCKRQEAQFVCAGCGNQWYCSRDCQVDAWDAHSEVCTG